MTYGSNAYHGYTTVDYRYSKRRKAAPFATLGNVALAAIAIACAGTLYINLGGPGFEAQPSIVRASMKQDIITLRDPESRIENQIAVTAEPVVTFAERFFTKDQELAAVPALRKGDRLQILASLKNDTLTPRDKMDVATVASIPPSTPAPVAAMAPPALKIQQVASAVPLPSIPLPMARPVELKALADKGPSPAEVARASKIASLKSSARSIFEKLFGKHEPSGAVLAYAGPDGGMPGVTMGGVSSDGKVNLRPPFDRETAVYDISAKTVYLPDGSQLEAHSGLGDKLDDPRYVSVRMRGATPPHVYDLTMRESLFHGVEALRLNPVGGEEAIHGRTGLLAHTYMLGPNGDSNGCVSFKDYNKFLAAYKNNQIKRLAVISSLN